MEQRRDLIPPGLTTQAERLVALGVPAMLGQADEAVRQAACSLADTAPEGGLLVPGSAEPDFTALLGSVFLNGKPGFVVEDFVDVSSFSPYAGDRPASVPDDWYVLVDPRRGDEFSNNSPAEAGAEIAASGRVPLTMLEGVLWALQCPPGEGRPGVLERNHCFMTIGSRKTKARGGFDARTPALWISNGTGRDGPDRKNAAKLGWCWWNNRHTWLGIAHAGGRLS